MSVIWSDRHQCYIDTDYIDEDELDENEVYRNTKLYK
jgi:hypothetical protein